MTRPKPVKAFTIIELLVVVAIISVLSGMLLPAMDTARAAARSALCKSNLHQLAIAMVLYIDSHSGLCMPISDPNDELSYWFGRRAAPFGEPGANVYDRKEGYLYPYLKAERSVERCPTFDAAHRASDGSLVGYAYNYYQEIPSGPPVRVGNVWVQQKLQKGLGQNVLHHRIKNPGQMVVLVDGGRVSRGGAAYYTPVGTVEENYYLDVPGASTYDCGVHFRHNGKANALFADWHVDEVEPASLSITGDGRVGHFASSADWPQYYCPDPTASQ